MDATVQPGGTQIGEPPVDDASDLHIPVWAKVVRRIGTVVLVLAALAAVAAATAVAFLPAAANATTMKVLSGSMEGTFSEGDVVVSKPVDAEDIEPGDVITSMAFSSDSPETQTVTHRVVEVLSGPDGPEFVTKGDANAVNDLGVTKAEDVKGEMWYHVPHAGDVRDAMFEPAGMFYAAGLLMLLVGAHLLLPRHAHEPAGKKSAANQDGVTP